MNLITPGQNAPKHWDRMASRILSGPHGAVGQGTTVQPFSANYRTGVMVQPKVVGEPARMVPQVPQGTIDYSPEQFFVGDVTYLGFGRTSIPAGGQVTVEVRPQRPFKPQRIFCPSNVQNLLILNVEIQGTGIFANSLGVPIELFSEVSTTPQIRWPTLQTATGAQFIVSNPTGGALFFSGMLYGSQVRN